MTLATRIAHSLLALILAGTLARGAHPQDSATTPLSPAAAAALAAKTAHVQHVQQLLAARENGTLHAPPASDDAPPAPTKSALGLPFSRLLPDIKLAIESAYSTGVVAGDWNGDGLFDLATEASKGGGNPGLAILRQQSGADFATSQVKGSLGDVLAKGDVNGDGLTDLVDLGSKAWVFLGQPGGGFVKTVGTTIGDFSFWEALGDLNGDGRADIATVDFFGTCNCVHLALGLATGTFDVPYDVTAGTSPGGVGIADMNGDGHLDVVTLAAPTTSNKVIVLPGLGDGTFAPAIKTSIAHSLFPLDIVITDADGDGMLDVEALELSTDSPTFEGVDSMLGHGDGSFTRLGNFPCSILGNLMTHGDLDGNGTDDLAVANYDDYYTLTGGGMDVLLGVGDGSFGAATTRDLGGSPYGATTADLDGDGDLDVALSQELQYIPSLEDPNVFAIVDLGLALGHGDGTFPSGDGSAVGAPAEDAATTDIDGDGAADLVVTRKGSVTTVSALAYELATPGDDAIGFAPAVDVSLGTDGRHVAAADLDGDGLGDIVLESNLDGGSLRVLQNIGHGTGGIFHFQPAQTLGAVGVDALHLADLDGDGEPDVLALRGDAQRVDVVLNAGFTFGTVTQQPIGVSGTALSIADVDGDGALDAVLAAADSDALQVLTNANGKLVPQPPMTTTWAPAALATADFDGDGHVDLACLTDAGLKVHLLAGQGGGAFADAGLFTLTQPATTLVAVDLDRDHAPDLVLSRPARAELLVRRGLGNFTFEATQSIAAPLGTSTLRTADVDGDLFPDVIAVGYDEAAAQVLLSQSEWFTNAGHALAASYGTPHLAVSGLPFAGDTVSMTVSGVPAQAIGLIVIGTSAVMQPFHGGTLVPAPQAAVVVIPGVPVSSVWSDAPAGYAVWCQAWFSNGVEAAASNGVVAVTQ